MAALSQEEIVAVVGAGVMGGGIAQVAAAAGHRVLLWDARPDAAPAAKERIAQSLERQVQKGRITYPDKDALVDRIQPCGHFSELFPAKLVIEAILEDLAAKRDLLKELEAMLAPDAILATNTSSLSVTEMASGLFRPERLAGMHFFNPAPAMPLVEVVSGLLTHPEVADALVETARAWGKEPVRSRSEPGFIVNRGARPYYGEPLAFVEEGGCDFATADALFRGSGFKMGPFELIDLVGLDLNLTVSRGLWAAYYGEPRYRPSRLVEERVAAGLLGRKTGYGFHPSGGAPLPEPAVLPPFLRPERVTLHGGLGPAGGLVDLCREASIPLEEGTGDGFLEVDGARIALTDGRMAAEHGERWVLFDLFLDAATPLVALASSRDASSEAVKKAAGFFQAIGKQAVMVEDRPGMLVARTVCMLVNEACDTVLRGVATAEDVVRAMEKGLSFPGGPFSWADRLGADYCLAVLDHMAAAYGDGRHRASLLLRRAVAAGARLHV